MTKARKIKNGHKKRCKKGFQIREELCKESEVEFNYSEDEAMELVHCIEVKMS